MLAFSGNTHSLFRSAILESGSLFNPTKSESALGFVLLTRLPKVVDVTFYQPIYNMLVSKLGCTTAADPLACIRHLPSTVLQATLGSAPFNSTFNPLIDGTFLPNYPSVAIVKGEYAHIPILIGTNTGRPHYTNIATC